MCDSFPPLLAAFDNTDPDGLVEGRGGQEPLPVWAPGQAGHWQGGHLQGGPWLQLPWGGHVTTISCRHYLGGEMIHGRVV